MATVLRSNSMDHFHPFDSVELDRTVVHKCPPLFAALLDNLSTFLIPLDNVDGCPDKAVSHKAGNRTAESTASVVFYHAQLPPPLKGKSNSGKIVPIGKAVSIS